MRISVFSGLDAATVAEHNVTWQDVVNQCSNPPAYPTKQSMPLIKLAAFGSMRTQRGSLRHDANMLAISGIEADYDGEQLSVDAAVVLLAAAQIECVVYTSPSHTDAAPRWRVLAPVSHELPTHTRRGLVARLNHALGGVLAGESFTSSQSFYIGRVDGAPYRCEHVRGAMIDTLVNMPEAYPANVARTAVVATGGETRPYTPNDHEQIALERIATTMREAAEGERHYGRLRAAKLAGGFIGGGVLDYEPTMSYLHTISDEIGITTPTEWQTIIDGVSSGMSAPIYEARRPLDTAAIGFGAAAVASVAVTRSAPPVAQPINGSRLAFPADQRDLIFKGCVYISSENKILVPGGWLLDRQRFDSMVGGYSFVMNNENSGSPCKSAWEAFLLSQAHVMPRAEGLCFRPELPPGELVPDGGVRLANIWWPVQTERVAGDVSPFLDYMKRVLPDETDRSLLVYYMAAMVQHPGAKFSWCPVVQGAKGNGKTLIGTSIERALGDRYCHRPNSADIGNKFTGWLRGKLAIIVEELSTHEKRELLETLKPLITNRRVEIQSKGADQATGDNRANFIMFVNEQGAMPIDEDERRYAVFHTAQQSYADIVRDGMGGEYFPNLYRWADGGGYAHIAHYLATLPIPDELNPATRLHRAPRTTSTGAAIAASLGSLEQVLLEHIESNATPGMMNGWVSSVAARRVIDEARRGVSPKRIGAMLHALGYVLHPGLPEGRSHVSTLIDGCRPKLYVKKGSPHTTLAVNHDIVEAYRLSQQ